ncbi:sodium/pantothenate symporter [Bacillus tuaregi]|uniref:sodium/pantothenate symporter n=1 Tax=Bacillus tuaregi TaxID=1816695 RepID=UPI0008F8A64C|nr:sodium/pantothenate symporter [Bacillus tuaregi]
MNTAVIIPLSFFLILYFLIGVWANRFVKTSTNFLQEYFLGGRELGGFVLAMTLIATYGSASSFIGGPGVAYTTGLGWVLLSMAQLPAGYFVLMVLGKKFAIMARKNNYITVIDFLKDRYKSNIIVLVSALSIIIFLFSSMIAQWVGGGRLIESLTGLSYQASLLIFAFTVLLYVLIGGFRAVVLTDTVQGIVMLVGTIILLIATIVVGGGLPAIMSSLAAENPDFISPYGADRQLTSLYVSTFWILIGVGVIGLPQMAVRAMSYKDSKSMHQAIIIGTIVIGTIMFGMHLIGVLARAVLPGIEIGDKVMPMLTLKVLSPFLAGLVLSAPMAAIMSTISSLLILVSSTIVKDIFLNFIKPDATEKQIKQTSLWVTTVIGATVILFALNPPELLAWLNLFAFGGLESVFLWPIVLGLYWGKGNKYGAISSMIIGMGSYILIDRVFPSAFGMHTVVLPVLLSLVTYVLVSLTTVSSGTRCMRAE